MSAYTGSCFFRGVIMGFLMKRLLPMLLILAGARAAEIKPVPPPGVAVPAADRAELEAGLARLGHSIDKIRSNPLSPRDHLPQRSALCAAVRPILQDHGERPRARATGAI